MATELEANAVAHGFADRVSRRVDQAVDCGLAGIVFVAPLFMGGRHDMGRLVFVGLVCLTAVLWFCRQSIQGRSKWRWTGAEWVILASLFLISLQLIPLPASLLEAVSPAISDVIPMWTVQAGSDQSLGTWSRISLTPIATQGGLVMFAAFAFLFVVVVQRIEQIGDIERFTRWIAIAAALMAVIGLAQLLFGNGNFLWIYEHPFRDTTQSVKGTFSNPNHCAQFLALGIAPLIWWIQRQRVQKKGRARSRDSSTHASRRFSSPTNQTALTYALCGGLGCVALAGILTMSRGGVVVMFLATAICVTLFARHGLLGKRSLMMLLGVGVVAGAAVMIFGSESLMREFSAMNSGKLDDLDHNGSRRKLWSADLEAASDFPWLGTGAASHPEVYPIYYDDFSHVEFTHSENGYLQVLMETGIAGLTLLLVAIGLCCWWSFCTIQRQSSAQSLSLAAVLTAGLAVSLTQSIWDFVWYIPACMSITVIQLACACRLRQLNRQRNSTATAICSGMLCRFRWGLIAAAVCVLSAIMVYERTGPALAAHHWDEYLRQMVAFSDSDESEETYASSLIQELQQALRWDPNNARIHSRLASLHLGQFDLKQKDAVNSVNLVQIRNSAFASQFESRDALNGWLTVAIGDNMNYLHQALHHTHRALELCPLQGECYVALAGLSFLEGANGDIVPPLIEQALLLRPHKSAVRFAAGREAILAGDAESAIAHWKLSFREDSDHRLRILELLVPQMPAEFFLTEFDPDMEAMGQIYQAYRNIGRNDQAKIVAVSYGELLSQDASVRTGPVGSRAWYRAYRMFAFADQLSRATECLDRAVQHAPTDAALHRELASLYMIQKDYESAIEELRWCLRRSPSDKTVRQLLDKAQHARLDQQISPSAPIMNAAENAPVWR